MALSTEDSLLKASWQEEELKYSIMVINTLASSSKIKCMDMENINVQMATYTLANIRMET